MLAAIWAQSVNGVIGDGKTMPWRLPEDLRHFKETTMGSSVIMGRRTWESLPEKNRPLPGRENFILSSREPGDWSKGAQVITELPESGWVMGGGEVYAATLDRLDRIEVTLIDVHLTLPSPVTAPSVPDDFTLISDTDWLTSASGRLTAPGTSDQVLRYRFLSYERKDQ